MLKWNVTKKEKNGKKKHGERKEQKEDLGKLWKNPQNLIESNIETMNSLYGLLCSSREDQNNSKRFLIDTDWRRKNKEDFVEYLIHI